MAKQHQKVGHHHIVPRARGGYDQYWNSFSWGSPKERARKHVAWHALFAAMLPSEAMQQIEGWTGPREGLNSSFPAHKRDHWKACFGKKATPGNAMGWIEDNFLPAEVKWRRILRRSWRHLFGDMDLGEARDYIKKRWSGKEKLQSFKDIFIAEYTNSDNKGNRRFREAWQNLFGQRLTTPEKALKVINDRYACMIRKVS